MGVLNRVSIWIALRRHFSPVPRKVCIDFLCQIYRPIGLFSVGISSNGRISVGLWLNRPIVVFQYSTPPVSLKYKLRPLEKDTALSRHTKKNELFFHLRKKAYLCSWTITSWEMPLKDTSLWMHSWSPRRAKCGKSQDTHAKRAWEGNSPRHIEGVYSTLCLRHTEILQSSVSKSRI